MKDLEISSPTLTTPIKFGTTATAVRKVIKKGQTIKKGPEYTLSITFEMDQQVNGLTFRWRRLSTQSKDDEFEEVLL